MMKTAVGLAALLAVSVMPGLVQAQGKPVRIGVLNDMSGIYADDQGPGSVIAAKMAVEDFGNRLGVPVEVIAADHQNKTDVGAAIARRWYEQDSVDLIVDVPNSAIALAVAGMARDQNRVFIASGAGTSELTGKSCTPNSVHWTYDTWAQGHSMGQILAAQGGKRWYFITADYAFGKDLEKNAAEAVTAAGGTVLGSARHPLGTSDFSSFLLQAQASGADVIGLANAGADTVNALKQAAEFGIGGQQRVAALILNIVGMPGVGLAASQGVSVVSAYYWDRNDNSREFAKRFSARHPRGNVPNDMQAGVYSAVLHYLKAVESLKSAADGRAVVAAMKAMPTDDPLFGPGSVRADGRKLHPLYLLTTKPVKDSRGGWDFFTVTGTIPPEQAWRPLADGGCPLVKG
ncbi:ABC transporter substrate-binding protein [Azospirillum griseum]|uniref:ABC transporter substrate-binding protein n=1 Tax=Azospirillum griseum TaxID=2496639 RepID=A0A431VET3_9PROT|nr:ABC transporter substrate-binding protein [Azospirillum griseum]RTR18086.1 ABC transporter substrate-binding protein [Azospirillum griseum]